MTKSIKYSLSKIGDKNPMKRPDVAMKSGNAHKGQIPWCKGLSREERLKHYPNGFKGGRMKGYKHTEESKRKMSQNTLGKKHKVLFNNKRKSEYSERMKKNRKDLEFNQKMFDSLKRSITKPHIKVKGFINKYTQLQTKTNYAIKVGKTIASIDEAEPIKKIAIFIDGNYWHNYPYLRIWDKCCNTYLKNNGWKVLRFWESDIKNNPDLIIYKLKKVEAIREQLKE